MAVSSKGHERAVVSFLRMSTIRTLEKTSRVPKRLRRAYMLTQRRITEGRERARVLGSEFDESLEPW